MSLADDVRRLVACPKCGIKIGLQCDTSTGRNHTERVKAAIAEELAEMAREVELDPKKMGLP